MKRTSILTAGLAVALAGMTGCELMPQTSNPSGPAGLHASAPEDHGNHRTTTHNRNTPAGDNRDPRMQEAIERLQKENAQLRRELDAANTKIRRLENAR